MSALSRFSIFFVCIMASFRIDLNISTTLSANSTTTGTIFRLNSQRWKKRCKCLTFSFAANLMQSCLSDATANSSQCTFNVTYLLR